MTEHVEVQIAGQVVLLDQEDWERVKSLRWWVNNSGYAVHKWSRRGDTGHILLHRFIVGAIPDGMAVDHINRNRLDNRRANLRVVTRSENALNSNKRRGSTSKHKGVSRVGDRWQVVVRIDGKLKWVGKYDTEAEAAAIAAPYFDTPDHQPIKYGVTGDSSPR